MRFQQLTKISWKYSALQRSHTRYIELDFCMNNVSTCNVVKSMENGQTKLFFLVLKLQLNLENKYIVVRSSCKFQLKLENNNILNVQKNKVVHPWTISFN
jgi:hypothetical protein